MNKPAIQSVANAFSILEYVLGCSMISEGTELADIAKRFGMQKTTVRNMMQTLEYCGYIRRTARGVYCAGEKCAMLSKAGLFAGQLREHSLAFLKQAAEKTGESFILTTLFNGQRLIVASVSGNSIISVNPEAVEREQKYNYARVTRRLLLACASPSERENFIALNGLPPENHWPEAHAGRNAMDAELETIRQQGYCEAPDTGNFYALAVPVFDSGNRFLAALGVYAPAFRADNAKKELLAETLRETAVSIQTNL